MADDLMPPGSPHVTSDEELRRVIARWHRLRWAAVVVLAIVFAVAVGIGGYTLARDQSRLAASCSFYRDLGSVALPVPGGKDPRPSELGVKIVVDARASWLGQGCPGSLPAPTPALRHWVAYYHLPGVLQ